MDWKIRRSGIVRGEITVPPDKSISHRAIMFGSLASGTVKVDRFLRSEDCLSTLDAFRALGVDMDDRGETITIKGRGVSGLKAPGGPVYLGNSGTSMRIMSGILAGQDFTTILTGDGSLNKRPMRRVMEPLRCMGAQIEAVEGGDHAPLRIKGSAGCLKPVDYSSGVASAQVKSCVLAAGIYADGLTSFTEPFQSRDHTERMLEYFSADISRRGLTTSIKGPGRLEARDIAVPGDISSAAFFIIAALLAGESELLLRNVGLNPTRMGVINVLKRMGASIEVLDEKDGLEPAADLRVSASHLKGTVVSDEEIPLLIDEIPILTVAASMAEGETEIRGVAELKVKETDRVKSMVDNLREAGAELYENKDSLFIKGGVEKFRAAEFKSFKDHRTAMSMAVAALNSAGESAIRDVGCVNTSYPDFIHDLNAVAGAGCASII